MNQVLLFTVAGIGTGALIGGVAVSLVAFYRGSGAINLAAGAIAMVCAYTFWSLRGGASLSGAPQGVADLPAAPAVALTLVVSAGIGVLFEFAIFRPLRSSPPLAKLVATLGVLMVAQAGILLAFGSVPQQEPSILPSSTVALFGGRVPSDQFILAGIVLVAALGLAASYRWTRFGIATRAATESQESAVLAGLSPSRLSMANALIGCVLAGGLGVLAAPIISLDTDRLPLIVVPALAAALLANFSSVTVACVAGLVIGMLENLLYYASVQPWFPTDQGQPLPGVQDVLIFLVIAGMLRWRGASLPGRGTLMERRLPRAPRPQRLLRPALIATAAGVSALIVLPFAFRQALMNTIIASILGFSLVLVTGFSGQVSVMQLALSGAAGLIVSHLASAGVGFPFAIILGGLAATAVGLLTALFASRVRGVTLAVFTLAAAIAIQQFALANASWGAGGIAGAPVAQPSLLGLNLGNAGPFRGLDGLLPSPVLGFVALAFAVGLGMLVANIRRGALGRRMLAVRSNERAAAAAGVDIRAVKLTAFGGGAFIAGVAGALYGYDFSGIALTRFSALTGLAVVAFAYIGGITMVSGAVFAGLIAVEGVVQYGMQQWFGIDGIWAIAIAGVGLVVSVIWAPAGWSGALHDQRERRRARSAPGDHVSHPARTGAT